MEDQSFSVTLIHKQDYSFLAEFDDPGAQPLLLDELPPLGEGAGPSPSRLLATAVAHCLSASLYHCLRKQRIEVGEFKTTLRGRVERNERGRLRLTELKATLEPSVPAELLDRMKRCQEVFEDFCIVTESVRQGIDVQVTVEPAALLPA